VFSTGIELPRGRTDMSARRFVRLDHRAATAVLVDVTPAEVAGHRRTDAQMRAVARRAARRRRRRPGSGRPSLLPNLADISMDALLGLDSPALRKALARVMGEAVTGPQAAAGFNSAL